MGFRPDHLLTMRVALPAAKYQEDAQRLAGLERGALDDDLVGGVFRAGACGGAGDDVRRGDLLDCGRDHTRLQLRHVEQISDELIQPFALVLNVEQQVTSDRRIELFPIFKKARR